MLPEIKVQIESEVARIARLRPDYCPSQLGQYHALLIRMNRKTKDVSLLRRPKMEVKDRKTVELKTLERSIKGEVDEILKIRHDHILSLRGHVRKLIGVVTPYEAIEAPIRFKRHDALMDSIYPILKKMEAV